MKDNNAPDVPVKLLAVPFNNRPESLVEIASKKFNYVVVRLADTQLLSVLP